MNCNLLRHGACDRKQRRSACRSEHKRMAFYAHGHGGSDDLTGSAVETPLNTCHSETALQQ